jgi:hypothetical protein
VLTLPLVGFKCPASAPTAGAHNSFDHCVNACPHQCQPRFVLKKIAERETGNEHKGDMISPTALSGCVRMLKLTRIEDYYAVPQAYFDATRGALVHGFMENCGIAGVEQEKRVYKLVTKGPLAPWLISGRVDYYDRPNERIEDIKTMSDKGLYIVYKTGFKPEHAWQLNLYRWLMDGGRVVKHDAYMTQWLENKTHAADCEISKRERGWGETDETPEGFSCDCPTGKDRLLAAGDWPADAPGETVVWPVRELQLHFFFMNRVISTGTRYVDTVVNYERRKGGPNYGRPYGCEVSRRSLGVNAKGYDVYEIVFDIPAVPLYDSAKVEAYLIAQGPERVKAFREPDYMPPAVIGNKDLEWLCSYCDVKERCLQIEAGSIPVAGVVAADSLDPEKAHNQSADAPELTAS